MSFLDAKTSTLFIGGAKKDVHMKKSEGVLMGTWTDPADGVKYTVTHTDPEQEKFVRIVEWTGDGREGKFVEKWTTSGGAVYGEDTGLMRAPDSVIVGVDGATAVPVPAIVNALWNVEQGRSVVSPQELEKLRVLAQSDAFKNGDAFGDLAKLLTAVRELEGADKATLVELMANEELVGIVVETVVEEMPPLHKTVLTTYLGNETEVNNFVDDVLGEAASADEENARALLVAELREQLGVPQPAGNMADQKAEVPQLLTDKPAFDKAVLAGGPEGDKSGSDGGQMGSMQPWVIGTIVGSIVGSLLCAGGAYAAQRARTTRRKAREAGSPSGISKQ